ncbi:MAG TPA: hypothetical protein VI548_00200 [Chitinophagaceae bacterium]|nr:hypothetical protein [Chitinophagaceae bacterium]
MPAIHSTSAQVNKLFSIRNLYSQKFTSQKIQLLKTLYKQPVKNKTAIHLYADTLHFLLAYPDNKILYLQTARCLAQLESFIKSNKKIKESLYNSGITATSLCAAFSFEIAKWMRKEHPENIRLISFEAKEGQIQSVLSVLMPKVESEIFQDGNVSWRPWLQQSMKKGEDLLDRLIAVFDETDIRPEVKDELWNAIGINLEIDFPSATRLPHSMFTPYFHRSIIKKEAIKQQPVIKIVRINLNEKEAAQIIDCSRMVLLRQLREIDPVTFTAANLISYYRLDRGLSVALMSMRVERRHPIDSYYGYVVFKNGLPVAYAGSWIFFDSARIGLNVFPAYRGGESQYIFEQVLNLHRKVYKLKRFTVDPYQIGKENSDGIHSGAFWIYYHAGFRPLNNELKKIATKEAKKINMSAGYRTPVSILKKLANSRAELILQKNAVNFDATDISRAYAAILKIKYDHKRMLVEEFAFKKLTGLLRIKNYHEPTLQYILKNWSILLLCLADELEAKSRLKKELKKMFELKAFGAEEDYIVTMQQSNDLRLLLKKILKEFVP